FNDFTEITPLRTAESAFYEVGLTAEEAGRVLDRHLVNLSELARFIVAHVTSVVVGDRRVLTDAAFVDRIKLEDVRFDAERMRADHAAGAPSGAARRWSFDPFVLDPFRGASRALPAPAGA